jgi:phosphatidylserine/phosphatidylglycerophosphate/cardiolipin synthase-like enzyme
VNVNLEFLTDDEIYHRVMREEIPGARRSVFIATALAKQTTIEISRGEFRPFMKLVDNLLARRVWVGILLAGKPSKGFLDSMASHPRVRERLEFRVCARNHMKIVLVDNERLYLGSANLTGAGMGRKSDDRRNFEFGLFTTDT